MTSLYQNCRITGQQFVVEQEDIEFYDKVSPVFQGVKYTIPLPTLCPYERARNRMSWRNERKLYSRTCDFSGKKMISLYPADAPYIIYDQAVWWGDDWDGTDYGRAFDFNRPFFEQFGELLSQVPRLSIVNSQHHNSEYCNYAFSNKNCYLTFGSFYQEDCMYDNYCKGGKNSLDNHWLYDSELCYECLFSRNLYKCLYVDHSDSSQECMFSIDLRGCQNCFGCQGLRQKKYHIFNKPYTPEDYFKYIGSLELHTYNGLERVKSETWATMKQQFMVKNWYQTNTENGIGDNLVNDKNMYWCFDCTNCEDVKYGAQLDEVYTSHDMTCMGYERSELIYYNTGGTAAFHNLFCSSSWNTNSIFYCDLCMHSSYLFGCVSLQKKEYCILNKQYTREEYEILVPKIIEHMKETGEWGEFFPIQLSPFAYNETIAQDYLPMTKAETVQRGYRWKEENQISQSRPEHVYDLRQTIDDTGDDVCTATLFCEVTQKPYRIIPEELSFYRLMNIPIPRRCPDQRHADRLAFRNPRHLYPRTCEKCSQEILSSYTVDSGWKVSCEACYMKEIY